jgi:M6 family metalloprotease-like protein
VKAGSSCSKAGIKSVSAGKTYTCVKSGKKLVWDKGFSNSNTAQAGQVNPTQNPIVSPSSNFAKALDCKLSKPKDKVLDGGPFGSIGFPRASNALTAEGNVKGLVLIADFSDVVATNDVIGQLNAAWKTSSIPNAEKFFAYTSYGKLKLKVEITSKVYRLQKPSTYYALGADPSGGPLPGSPPPKIDEVVSDAMTVADSDIDFSQYAFVTVTTPQSPSLAISGVTGMGSSPKSFDGVTYTQNDFVPLDSLTPLDKPYRTLNFTHDIGHMLGLMHPYITGPNQPMTGAWDIMWSFAFQNDFYGWNKWRLGWITDAQVSCIDNGPSSELIQLLSPVGIATSAQKMVVIKVSETTALAIESRRKSPFEDLKLSDEGVIVYRVDTTKSDGLGPITLISNPNKQITYQNFRNVLGTMKPGQSVTESGYLVSVLSSVTEGDYISIKKVG